MGLANYTELQAAVAQWLNRTDVSGDIPDFIKLAEADIETDLRGKVVTIDEAISIDSDSVTLPGDIKMPKSLYDEYGPILLTTPDEVARLRKLNPSGAIRASHAAILTDGTDFLLLAAPVPASTVVATLVYEPSLPALSDEDSTWLLTRHPGVYLYGALRHGAVFLRDPEQAALWEKLYLDQMSKLKGLRDDLEFGASPLIAAPRSAIGV
jgi:hypothetical protein